MKAKEIEKNILELIILQVGEHKDFSVTSKSSFEGDLSFDSLDNIEFIMAIEEKFDLEIPDDIAEDFNCITDVVGYVSKNS